MSNPLVSVLMTAYNREKYIGDAIESVIGSTYSNFELIIVDDCSSDNTVEIAKQYEAKDNRIKVYENESNLGDYNNRNKAASYALGKYIKYLDSDDMIYPHGLDVMVAALEKFPDVAMAVAGLSSQVDKPYPLKLQPAESYRMHFFKAGILDCGPSGIIFRTSVFREFNGFSGKRHVGDIELTFKISARYPIAVVNSSLVYWRQHPEQEMVKEKDSIEMLKIRYQLLQDALNSTECPLSEDEKKISIQNHRKILCRGVLNIFFKRRRPMLALKMYRAISLTPMDTFNAVFRINH